MARRQNQPAPSAPPAEGQEIDPQIASMPFDQAVEELEAILERIEGGSIGLEESLRQFRRGDALVRRCRSILDAAELQVREIAPRDDDAEDDDAASRD